MEASAELPLELLLLEVSLPLELESLRLRLSEPLLEPLVLSVSSVELLLLLELPEMLPATESARLRRRLTGERRFGELGIFLYFFVTDHETFVILQGRST